MTALGSHREVIRITDSSQSQIYFLWCDWNGVQLTMNAEKLVLILENNEAAREMFDRK
jgi:hypothetical protein